MSPNTTIKVSAAIVTIVLVVLLLTQVRIDELIATFRSAELKYVLAGFVMYTACYLFRALRFHALMDKEVGIRDLFAIVCVHNMANSILPARTGELSYVYLLKKMHNKTLGDGAATLIVGRILDLMSISLLFFVFAMLAEELPKAISNLFSLIAIFAAGVFMAFNFYRANQRKYSQESAIGTEITTPEAPQSHSKCKQCYNGPQRKRINFSKELDHCDVSVFVVRRGNKLMDSLGGHAPEYGIDEK